MTVFYLKSSKIVLENEIIEAIIKIEDGKIAQILSKDADIEVENLIDYGDNFIAPGYFDTHVHGFGGFDIMDCSEESVQKISEGIVQYGVTSFLPTTLTDTSEKLDSACKTVHLAKDKCRGAKIQGIFLEGPFFTEKHKGAQNSNYMSSPDIDKLKKWNKSSKSLVKKIAIAPEHENTPEFIKDATKEGVTVALGHSDASFEEAMLAVYNGAKIFVHTYNGMSPLHHRNPGMVGAAMASDAYCECICDGHHVHQGAIKVLKKIKGKEKTVLVTDCMSAGGMPDGDYKLGEFDVIVKNGTARLHSGSLAGSVLNLHQAVKNLIDWKIATPLEAISMASITPAKSVGLDKNIGSIAVGKDADFNIIDENFDIVSVYINGKQKYVKN